MQKKPTSYRELDDHVIIERTQPIDSSDTGDEDTVHKRMREDETEYSPSDNNDEEEYNEDEDELETPTAANADRLYHDDRQYQSVEFYNAEKRLIDRYEDVSDGVKADISPDPLVIGHGIGGKYIPIMARLAEARRWSKRRQTCLSSPDLTAIHNE